MNKKLNRMQFILIIASLFIMFANISLFTSDLIKNDILRSIIGILIPSLLLVISYEVEKELKLDKSSRLITLMSMVSFFITIVGTYFNIIDNVSTVNGFLIIKSINLNIYTVVALAGVIIPAIGYFLNKDEIYKKILVISTLYLAYFILNSIYNSLTFSFFGMTNNNRILEYVTLSLILLLYNLYLSNRYSKTLSLVNFFYTIYVISNVSMGIDTLVSSIAISAICIIAFLFRIRKEESVKYDTVPFIGIVLFLITLIVNFSEELLILPLGFIIVTDMLIIVADMVKNRKEGLIYKIVLDILTMIVLIIAISNEYHIIPMVLIVLITSLVSTYALKSDSNEQYVLPFKTVLCIIGLLVEINKYVDLSFMIILLIINVFAVLCSYFQNDKILKRLFSVIVMLTFAFSMSLETTFDFIVLLSMIVFDYVIQFEVDKRSIEYKNIFVILSMIIIIYAVGIFKNPVLYLLVALIFFLAHIVLKEKGLNIISFIAFIFSSIVYVTKCGISYEASDILSVLLFFGGAFYLTTKIESFDKLLLRTIILWGLIISLFNISTLISSLVALVISILVLLIYMKENNMMFKSGVVLTILGILSILQELDEVPIFVYMLVLGITVVFIIFKSIKKYISEPHEEEQTKEVKVTGKKYCTNCGTEVKKDSKYCTNCGNKLSK